MCPIFFNVFSSIKNVQGLFFKTSVSTYSNKIVKSCCYQEILADPDDRINIISIILIISFSGLLLFKPL